MQLSGMVLQELTRRPEYIFDRAQPLSALWPIPTRLSTDFMELVHMYNEFYLTAESRLDIPRNESRAALVLDPIWLFQPISPVYPILRRDENSRISRLLPLLFINLLLLKSHHSPPECKTAIYHLYRQNLSDTGVDGQQAFETLVWALITDTRELLITDVYLVEATLRMGHATTKLPYEVQRRLADTLCDFILLFQEEAVVGRENWWTPEQFEKILAESNVAAAKGRED
jgi:hypothetical protein